MILFVAEDCMLILAKLNHLKIHFSTNQLRQLPITKYIQAQPPFKEDTNKLPQKFCYLDPLLTHQPVDLHFLVHGLHFPEDVAEDGESQ